MFAQQKMNIDSVHTCSTKDKAEFYNSRDCDTKTKRMTTLPPPPPLPARSLPPDIQRLRRRHKQHSCNRHKNDLTVDQLLKSVFVCYILIYFFIIVNIFVHYLMNDFYVIWSLFCIMIMFYCWYKTSCTVTKHP